MKWTNKTWYIYAGNIEGQWKLITTCSSRLESKKHIVSWKKSQIKYIVWIYLYKCQKQRKQDSLSRLYIYILIYI